MAYGSVLTDVVQSSTAGTPPQFNDGNGTQTGTLCRAWVNFNGTSGSVAARASFNVSSVTRSSAGIYVISFTNAMPDTNYAAVSGATDVGTNVNAANNLLSFNTTNITYQHIENNTGADSNILSLAIFR